MGWFAKQKTPILIVTLGAPLVFPLVIGILWASDWATGDAVLHQRLLFESRRQLLFQFCGDWLQSLPAMYAFAVALVSSGYALGRWLGRLRVWLFVLSGAVVGSVCAMFLAHSATFSYATVSLILAGTLSGGGFGKVLVRSAGESK